MMMMGANARVRKRERERKRKTRNDSYRSTRSLEWFGLVEKLKASNELIIQRLGKTANINH